VKSCTNTISIGIHEEMGGDREVGRSGRENKLTQWSIYLAEMCIDWHWRIGFTIMSCNPILLAKTQGQKNVIRYTECLCDRMANAPMARILSSKYERTSKGG
jgi:hypothetical protein